MASSLVFIIHSPKIVFDKKKRAELRIDSAASSGGQRKLTYLVYFPWPPLEAALESFVSCCL